jgi:hypothetical protein
MTPKEKVDKLFFRFNAETVMQQPYEHELHMKKAKQSTVICIEEILKAREVGTTGVVFDKEYWEEALEIANAL